MALSSACGSYSQSPESPGCGLGGFVPLALHPVYPEAEPGGAECNAPEPCILLQPGSIPLWAGQLCPIPAELHGPGRDPPPVLLSPTAALVCGAPGQPPSLPGPCFPLAAALPRAWLSQTAHSASTQVCSSHVSSLSLLSSLSSLSLFPLSHHNMLKKLIHKNKDSI